MVLRARGDSEGDLTDLALRHEMKAKALSEDEWDDDVEVFEETQAGEDKVETVDDQIETGEDLVETDEEQLIE